jgi:hypothetical protein
MHSFVYLLFFFQLSDDGAADYDTIIGMLPEVMADRGGKMFNKCRHVSEYTARFVFRVKNDKFRIIFFVRKIKNIPPLLEYLGFL